MDCGAALLPAPPPTTALLCCCRTGRVRPQHTAMGVVGLLPLLQPVTRRVNVFAECRGKAVAVDASVWLHQVARQYAGDAPQEVGGSPSEEYVHHLCSVEHVAPSMQRRVVQP